ncbi:MAG: glycoside hydrolase family 1 protein, partial [Acidobacteria bacterium]
MADDDLLVRTSDLLIGVATASLQIEGGDRNNTWYDWSQLPGTIADGTTPLRATDHWNRWREDTALMADLGRQTYRMSVEWSRVEPRPGEVDRAALDRYHQEIAAVRDAGIV